jgi:hypothetical protein
MSHRMPATRSSHLIHDQSSAPQDQAWLAAFQSGLPCNKLGRTLPIKLRNRPLWITEHLQAFSTWELSILSAPKGVLQGPLSSNHFYTTTKATKDGKNRITPLQSNWSADYRGAWLDCPSNKEVARRPRKLPNTLGPHQLHVNSLNALRSNKPFKSRSFFPLRFKLLLLHFYYDHATLPALHSGAAHPTPLDHSHTHLP